MPEAIDGKVRPIRPDVRKSGVMRAVNDDLCALSVGLGCTEPIAFFCECRVATCFAALWQTTAEYQAVVAEAAGWILLDGHLPSAPFPDRRPADGAATGPAPDELSMRRARRRRERGAVRLRAVGEDAPPGSPPSAA
jgi:hypothetical protein